MWWNKRQSPDAVQPPPVGYEEIFISDGTDSTEGGALYAKDSMGVFRALTGAGASGGITLDTTTAVALSITPAILVNLELLANTQYLVFAYAKAIDSGSAPVNVVLSILGPPGSQVTGSALSSTDGAISSTVVNSASGCIVTGSTAGPCSLLGALASGTGTLVEARLTFSRIEQLSTNPNLDLTITNNTVQENNLVGSVVGDLVALDPVSTNTHSYSFVLGLGSDDNDKFRISGTSLRTGRVFVFGTDYSIRVRITASDGSTFDRAFLIEVTEGITSNLDTVTIYPKTLGTASTTINSPVGNGPLVNNNKYQLATPDDYVIPTIAVNSVQLIDLTAAKLSFPNSFFNLIYNGQSAVSSSVPGLITATQIQTMLTSLASIGTNNVSVSGVMGGPFTVTFQGAFAGVATVLITGGGGQSITVTSVITGGTFPSLGSPLSDDRDDSYITRIVTQSATPFVYPLSVTVTDFTTLTEIDNKEVQDLYFTVRFQAEVSCVVTLTFPDSPPQLLLEPNRASTFYPVGTGALDLRFGPFRNFSGATWTYTEIDQLKVVVKAFTYGDEPAAASDDMLAAPTTLALVASANEVQRIDLSPLAPAGYNTYNFIFNALTSTNSVVTPALSTASTVQSLLETVVGVGNVLIVGPTGGPFTATFQGSLSSINVAPIQSQYPISVTTLVNGGPLTEVQVIDLSGSPSGSGFTLTFKGVTSALSGVTPAGTTASTITTMLNNLSTVGSGNFTVNGTTGGPFTVIFQGILAFIDVPPISGSTGIVVTTTQTGGLPVIAVQVPASSGVTVNEVQSIVSVANTQVTFSFNGQSTATFSSGSATITAAALQTALTGLGTIGAGNVVVTGPTGGPWIVTFQGALAATDLPQIVSNSPTTVVVTTVTNGGYVPLLASAIAPVNPKIFKISCTAVYCLPEGRATEDLFPTPYDNILSTNGQAEAPTRDSLYHVDPTTNSLNRFFCFRDENTSNNIWTPVPPTVFTVLTGGTAGQFLPYSDRYGYTYSDSYGVMSNYLPDSTLAVVDSGYTDLRLFSRKANDPAEYPIKFSNPKQHLNRTVDSVVFIVRCYSAADGVVTVEVAPGVAVSQTSATGNYVAGSGVKDIAVGPFTKPNGEKFTPADLYALAATVSFSSREVTELGNVKGARFRILRFSARLTYTTQHALVFDGGFNNSSGAIPVSGLLPTAVTVTIGSGGQHSVVGGPANTAGGLVTAWADALDSTYFTAQTDGGNFSITVQLTDFEDVPALQQVSQYSITMRVSCAANATVSIIDPDTGVTNPGAVTYAPSGYKDITVGPFIRATGYIWTSVEFNAKTFNLLVTSTDSSLTISTVRLSAIVGIFGTAPTDISFSNTTVLNGTSFGSTLGVLSTTDAQGGPFTYSLVSGTGSTDNSSVTLSGTSVNLTSSVNYSTKSQYSFRVRSTDSLGLFFEKYFTVSVIAVPTDIALSNATITNGNPSGTTVGTLSTVDLQGGTFIYTFVAGFGATDNASFTLVGSILKTVFVASYSTKSSYSIRIRTTDIGGLFFEKSFTLVVNSVITNITLLTSVGNNLSAIIDGTSSGSTVATFVVTPSGGSFTYTLVSGTGSTDNASFTISGSSLITAFTANFSTKSSYAFRVRATDTNGSFFEKALTMLIRKAPTDIQLSNSTILDSSSYPSTVATLSSTDPQSSSFTYNLVFGTGSTDNSSFFVIGGNILQLAGTANYSTKNSYSIRIRTINDIGLAFDKQFTITVIGSTWIIRASPAGRWVSVCYGNGLFVAVAYNSAAPYTSVMTSLDGITWTSRTTPIDRAWLSVCYGNGLFVAIAGNGVDDSVVTSPDGITWTSRTTPINYDHNGTHSPWISVCYGNGLFVAVNQGDSTLGAQSMTSPDGITWTLRITPGLGTTFQSVCYGNGLFVAVGDPSNLVMTSPNGITWTSQTPANSNNWESVCYGNGLFVAVAYSGTTIDHLVMTSPDGITWTSRTTPVYSNNHWWSVTYGNGLFVAVGYNNGGTTDYMVMTSPDGITWTLQASPIGNSNSWRSVCYGNGLFVAVADSGIYTNNEVMTHSA